MPKINPLQGSFTGGELSPRWRGQTDTEKYATSLSFCENFVPTPYGSLEMRSGFQFIGFSQHIQPRLFGFERGLGGDVIVEVGPFPDGNVVIWDRNGIINEPQPFTPDPIDSQELFSDRSFIAGPANWRRTERGWGPFDFVSGASDYLVTLGSDADDFSGSAFRGGYLGSNPFFNNPPIQPQIGKGDCIRSVSTSTTLSFGYRLTGINQRVTTPDSNAPVTLSFRYSVAHQLFDFDPTQNRFKSGQPPPGLQFHIIAGTFEGGDNLLHHRIPITAYILTDALMLAPDFIPNTAAFYCGCYIGFDDGGFEALNGWNPPEISDDRIWATWGGTIRNPSCVVELPPVIPPDPPEPWDPPWTQEQMETLKVAQDSAQQIMYFVHPEVEPYVLFFLQNEDPQWQLLKITDLDVDLPPEFDQPDNWPGAVTFHQGRLWFGGTPNQSSTIWGSRVGDYNDFDIDPIEGEISQHVDPVQFNVATSGAIFWMASAKDLIIGCDKYEIIGTAVGGHIWTADYNFAQHSAWGTDTTQGIQVANEMLTVSGDSARIRSFADSERIMGYESNEVSIFGEHLLLERIREMDYAGLPYYMLSVLTSQARIHAMTYDAHAGWAGWYRIRTEGSIYSQAIAVDPAGTSLWVAVSRPNGVALEILNYGEFLGFNLDSFVLRVVQGDQTVTGLEHLEGQTVGAVIYGARLGTLSYRQHPPVLVTNGQVQLEEWAEGGVVIGMPYTATARTLPLEGASSQGTSQASKRRFNDIRLRLSASALPKVNGEIPPDRRPGTNMDESEPLITGDIKYGDIGWNNGVIEITQDAPLRTEIVGIFGTAVGNKL